MSSRWRRAAPSPPVLAVANAPSGLGWLPNGDLLVVSMTDRRLLAWDGEATRTHADLSKLASFHLNDMVVDATGRAYVGNFGFDLHAQKKPSPAELIAVDADGTARIAADGMLFPNGTVITTPDGDQLIVAESWGARLTAFDLEADGTPRQPPRLGNPRRRRRPGRHLPGRGRRHLGWPPPPPTNACA